MNRLIKILLILYVSVIPLSMAGMEVFAWLNFVVALFLFTRETIQSKKIPNIKLGPDIFLWGFWLALILGAIFVPDLSADQRIYIIGEGRWILLLYTVYYLLNHLGDEVKKIYPWIIFLFAVVALVAISEFWTGYRPFADKPVRLENVGGILINRISGFYQSTMTYCYGIGQWLCLFVAFALMGWNKNPKMKRATWATIVLICLSILLSFTRGAWLAVTVALLSMTYLYKKKIAGTLLILGFVFVAGLVVAVPTIRYRVTNIIDVSNMNRIKLWRVNWTMFKDHPLLGVGYRQNSTRTPEYYEKLGINLKYVGHAHNNFMQVLAGTGLLGFINYILFNLALLLSAYKLWKKTKGVDPWKSAIGLGVFGAYIHLHVGGLSESNFQDGEVSHTFVMLTALMLFTLNRLETKPIKNSDDSAIA